MSEWINAKDKLPEEHKFYMNEEKTGGYIKMSQRVLAIPKSCLFDEFYIPEVTNTVNGKWQWGNGFLPIQDECAFWMPLPEPPEKEERK